MSERNYSFNILTFDYPEDEVIFYFSEQPFGKCKKIHRSLFPKNIDYLFPGITEDGTEFIYTTYYYPKEEFYPMHINLSTENEDFVKKYYNDQLYHYFKRVQLQITRRGYIDETIVY